jgi:hypothetical protein
MAKSPPAVLPLPAVVFNDGHFQELSSWATIHLVTSGNWGINAGKNSYLLPQG